MTSSKKPFTSEIKFSTLIMTQQDLVTLFIERGYLPSPDISDFSLEEAHHHLSHLVKRISAKETPLVFHKDFTHLLQSQQLLDLNWFEFEKSRVMYEKVRNKNTYKTFLDLFTYTTDTRSKEKLDQALATVQRPEETLATAALESHENIESNVTLVHHYPEESRKRTVKDFVDYFRTRYAFLKNLLQPWPVTAFPIAPNAELSTAVPTIPPKFPPMVPPMVPPIVPPEVLPDVDPELAEDPAVVPPALPVPEPAGPLP
jgi:hypothetical protein